MKDKEIEGRVNAKDVKNSSRIKEEAKKQKEKEREKKVIERKRRRKRRRSIAQLGLEIS